MKAPRPRAQPTPALPLQGFLPVFRVLDPAHPRWAVDQLTQGPGRLSGQHRPAGQASWNLPQEHPAPPSSGLGVHRGCRGSPGR